MNESESVPGMPRPTRRRQASGWLLFAALGLAVASFAVRAGMQADPQHLGQAAHRRQSASDGPGATSSNKPTAARTEAAKVEQAAVTDSGGGDERLRQLAIGTWRDDYQGQRTMTLREDGTATMVVELSGMKAMLFAPRLQFEMEWSVANGSLKKRTLRGEPAAQVQWILQTMGDRVDESILELTVDRLLLLDKDGRTKYDWRRSRERQS